MSDDIGDDDETYEPACFVLYTFFPSCNIRICAPDQIPVVVLMPSCPPL